MPGRNTWSWRMFVKGVTYVRVDAVVLVAVLAAGCGAPSGGDSGVLIVSAAASLTAAFSEVEASFEAAHPGLDVVMNFGGSSSLREQILAGAGVDVFASADRHNMEAVAGFLDGPAGDFAGNELAIGVPVGNPGGLEGISDLARSELLIGLCAAEVPCGDLSLQALGRAGVVAAVDTNEPNVRALVSKLEAGELDAGLVYVTDLISNPRLEGVPMAAEFNVSTKYLIGVLSDASDLGVARSFVEFVRSDIGRVILDRHGFAAP